MPSGKIALWVAIIGVLGGIVVALITGSFGLLQHQESVSSQGNGSTPCPSAYCGPSSSAHSDIPGVSLPAGPGQASVSLQPESTNNQGPATFTTPSVALTNYAQLTPPPATKPVIITPPALALTHPPAPGATGHCPDALTVPASPPSSTFEVDLSVTCTVQSGHNLLLTAEITNADGHGNTEYYFANWYIRTDISSNQPYQAHVTSGVQRTYFVISVTPSQLDQIESKANTLGDGGYASLFDASIVSNAQPNKTP